jgi:DNA-binding IclR family transcriptional regulator
MSSSSTRALRILDEIARSDHPLSVTEIARALALPPGTVFRSLDALLRTGLAARYQASARYVAGPAAERLQRSVIGRFAVREICLPWLRQLASISAETVSLHVRIGWNEVRICSVPGTGEVMTLPPLGEIHQLGDSCAGLAILASLPKTEFTAYLAAQFQPPLEGGSEHEVLRGGDQVRLNLRRTLNRIASRGFATADGEHAAIAFPVRCNGQIAAAIAIEGPFSASATSEQISDCCQVIGNIEALASVQPSLFANPFAHL